jgi:vacuolar-type H+-ATPase subunit I/STV1
MSESVAFLVAVYIGAAAMFASGYFLFIHTRYRDETGCVAKLLWCVIWVIGLIAIGRYTPG